MLTDIISEVEELQATQQLTATLTPSSTVNIMSHEEDCCVQCQETGHIAYNCPNVWCFKCDEYSHIVVDCPHRIPPSGTPAHQHRPNLEIVTTVDQCHANVTTTGTDAIGLDHNPIITDTTAKVTMTPTEAVPGHTTGTTDDITGVVHDAHTQVLIHIIFATTLHTADHLHIGALQLTPETAADHTLDQPTNQLRKASTNLYHNQSTY